MTLRIPSLKPIHDCVPLTHATATIIRCCGSVDSISTKELLENGWECAICGRRIEPRGDVFKQVGRKIRRKNNWGKK